MSEEIQLPEPALPEGGEAPAVELPQEPAPAPTEAEVQEYLKWKRGDVEREIPAQAAQQVAEAMGWKNPQALINALQIAADAPEMYREAKALRQQYREQPQYQPPPVEQRWQNHLHQQHPPQDEADPIGMLQRIEGRMNTFDQYVQAQTQQQQVQMQRQQQALVREASREHQKFAEELSDQGVPHWKIPSMESLLTEADALGMFHSDAPVSDIYRRVYRMLNADDLAQAAVQKQMDTLRDRKARVPIPAARSAPTPPPSAGQNPLDGLTWGQGLEFLPDKR